MTQSELKNLLRYDPQTGIFTWLRCPRTKMKAGSQAGWIDGGGYRNIIVNSVQYGAHRLAWFYMTGAWPTAIDHINCVRHDNRWMNLRELGSLNAQNKRRAHKNNRLGFLGVSRSHKSEKFTAEIEVNGKRFHLGSFLTPEAAHAAYVEAKRKLHPACTL